MISALYCRHCPVWLCNIFLHFLVNRTIFAKKIYIEHKMCVLVVCTIFFSETFLVLRRIKRGIINVYRSSCKVPVIIVRYRSKLNFLYWFSKNYQIKFIEYPSSERRVAPCGRDRRTHIHDGASSRFSQFCERAKKKLTNFAFQISTAILLTCSWKI